VRLTPRRLLAAAVAPAAALALIAAAPQAATGATAKYKLSYGKLPNGSKPVLRWNPCQTTITYKVNLASVPSKYRTAILKETKTAVARVATATRMKFTYKGTTSEVPQPGSASKQSAEIIIAWTSPSKTRYGLYGATAGQGGFTWAWSSVKSGGKTTYRYAARRGFVVLDTPQALKMKSGFGSGVRRTNLLMHELGHAVGLQHVSDTRQLMYPTLRSSTPSGFASGDKAGLSRVGRNAGCLSTSYLPYRELS
jgi:hypothetical protein